MENNSEKQKEKGQNKYKKNKQKQRQIGKRNQQQKGRANYRISWEWMNEDSEGINKEQFKSIKLTENLNWSACE